MACVPLLLLLLEFFVLAPSPCFAQCPKNCQCTQQGITGSPSFKKTVDCSAKLGGLEVAPNVPTDATHLDLRNNRLKIVPSSLFLNTPNLKEVYLSGNPLTCDCQLYGLHNATRHLAKFTGTCYKPDRLRDKDIASLKLWDFCRGCALVKVAQNSNEDKEYSMEISANCDTHVRLFCRGMATDSPKEYITLISGQSKNYAYVHDYKQPSASRDKCVKASGGSMYTEAGLTNFSKVLVDLNYMSIVPDDFYYSTTSSGKRIKYGEAGDCYSASKESCRKGKFQIDLTGTGFRLKEEVYWEPYGTPSDIENSLDIDEDRTQVSAECGGYCGGCRAHGGNLAVELDYCPQEGIKTCYDPLGMANGSISNGQITASSQKIGKDKSFKAEYGRLNNKPSGAMGGAWCAQSSDKFQYLQIDLNKEMTLSGVATQGQIDAPNWVVKYSIQHSTDGTNWKDYKEFGHDRAFDGNVDQHNVVTNWFNQRFRARYVRIKPGLYSSPTNTICLRAELYGCVTDIVSVIIRSSSTKNCWSPRTISNPCEISDGSLFTLQSFCQGEGVMMAFRRDGSLIHSCSGKCVFKNAKDQLALRDGLCDTFAKRENPDGTIAISHQASGLCVRVDAGKNLILSNCSSPYLFETTQSGLHPISPKFKRNSPQYLTLNKPGWIHCQVISDPRAKLFWTKTLPWPNGEHLPDLEFLPFSNGSLFVRKAKKSYEGDFYCTAVNSGGIKLQDITVKVAELPNFVKRPSDLTTSVNNSVMFDCKATSDLGVKYSWFQLVKGSSTSTSVLKLDNRFNIFPNGSLNIRSVQKKDEAFYHCRAENPIGFNNVTAFLRVLVPPRFTIQPLGSAEPSGSSPVYNCQAVGDPVPTIRWTKVGSAQTPTEQLKNGSLLLRNIQKSDEGQYTCSATNIVKTAAAKITISVYTACRIDSQPNAFHRPDRKFFAVGEKVIVDCKPGFEKKQDGNLSCKADGNWNKRFPQCNDLDECAILSLPSSTQNSTKLRSCHDKARCVNTLGSYRCECTRGYAGDGFSCTAVCLPPSDDDNGEWMPNKPTYRIAETVWLNCDLGYKLADSDVSSVTCGKDTEWSTPNPSCQDKNECEEGSPCHKNADCVNTVGSFTCRCKERFEGDGVTECKEQKTRLVTGSDGKVWKYSAKMTDLNEKLKQFNDENISAEDLLATVLNSSAPSSGQPMAGDLVMIVMGMDTVLSNLNSTQRMASAKQVIQISSHILDKKNKEQWSEVQKDSKGVTEVMALLDKFAMKLASDLEKQSSENATVDIKTNNIGMKVMVKDANKFSTDVEYPQSSKQSNDGSAQIRLPQELFAKYKGDLPVKVTSFLFEDLGELLPKRGEGIKRFDVSSPIVSSSLSPVPSEGKLDPPVTITIRNKKPSDVEAIDKCVYWDFEKSKELGGSWSSDGCQMLSSGSNGTVCACDHLTSFALLSVYDKELVFGLKIYIGCGVLLLAVVLALIRHLYLYCKRRYERSIIHINLCLAIAAGIALFLGGLRLTKIPAVCTIVAALLQFFFIAMFCWAVCEGLQLFMTLATGKNKNSTRLKFFFIIGWIFPLIAVGVSLGVTQLQGYGNDEWCWLDYSHVLMWSYVCPAAGFTLVTLVLVLMILCYKGRVVDSKDRRKVCLSVLFLIFLMIAIAGTWVVAAIYVRHHEKSLWQYLFAGACILQGSLLLVYCFLDQTVKNFTFHYQIKRMQSKEKRNYYSTTDTVQYYGANAVDGKYKVTRPSIKESNTDLRGSSKRLSRIGSTTSGVFYDKEEYPPPIMDTPAPMDSAIKRKIEGLPIPDSPGGDVIQLQSFPNRKGSSSYYSLVASESTSDRDRRPDGAEEPEMGERRYSKTSMRKSADNLLSSHSRLQQIPERQPLMHSGYHQPESPESPPPYKIGERQRPFDNKRKSPFEEDHFYGSRDTALDSSRRKSRRSRRRLEEEFGKSDRESISQRKKSLRYSSGFFSGVTVEQDSQKVEKPHASL